MEMQENHIKENNCPETKQPSCTEKKKRSAVVTAAILAVAVVICIFVIGQVLSKGYVSLGGYSLFRVITGSMEPAIPVGSVLVAQETPINEIQPGDIVTYRSREAGMFNVIITHRVLSVYEGTGGKVYLETKGDANPYADGDYVDEDYLIGKVVFYTGEDNVFAKILNFMTGEVGFLACIVLPSILIGMFVMRDCIKGIRAELDTINQELDSMKQNSAEKSEPEQEEEDYEALCNRLRNELMKELKQGAAPEQTEQEPSAQQR